MSTDDESEGETTRVTRKGQVTIPKALREAYGIDEGDAVRWEATDDGIVVRKATRSAGRGMLVDDEDTETREALAEEMESAIRERRRSEWSAE
jgi:AbrB family looped-hinge helix DNA binding protein